MHDQEEYDLKKKAIFDSMAKRGQERILRIGYDNWEPFQEPKDPRERIFGSTSVKAGALVQRFYQMRGSGEESKAMHKDLFDLCRGLLEGESRAQTFYDFFTWYARNVAEETDPAKLEALLKGGGSGEDK